MRSTPASVSTWVTAGSSSAVGSVPAEEATTCPPARYRSAADGGTAGELTHCLDRTGTGAGAQVAADLAYDAGRVLEAAPLGIPAAGQAAVGAMVSSLPIAVSTDGSTR